MDEGRGTLNPLRTEIREALDGRIQGFERLAIGVSTGRVHVCFVRRAFALSPQSERLLHRPVRKAE